MSNQILTARGEAIAIRPLADRVLVKRLSTPPRDGVLWIPDIAQENSKHAQVIAMGPQVYGLSVGDEVLLPGIASKYPDWEQSDYMMVQQDDIGGIIG